MLLKAILDLGFENPTEVQEKVILHWKKNDKVALVRQDRENGRRISSYSENWCQQ
jgi:hypothetical protein